MSGYLNVRYRQLAQHIKLILSILIFYLMTAMTTPKSETLAIQRWTNMVLDDYDGQVIPKDECGPNSLTFVLQLRKNSRKNLNQELTQ